jgi:general secretion pathway protein I
MIGVDPKDAGFTLVEVLVSLAIFSLAIVGLNQAANLAVRGTADLAARTHAGFVADNAVVLSKTEPVETSTVRREAESGGRRFDVSVTTAATQEPGFYEISVKVSAIEGEQVIASRRAFRYASPNRAADLANEAQP